MLLPRTVACHHFNDYCRKHFQGPSICVFIDYKHPPGPLVQPGRLEATCSFQTHPLMDLSGGLAVMPHVVCWGPHLAGMRQYCDPVNPHSGINMIGSIFDRPSMFLMYSRITNQFIIIILADSNVFHDFKLLIITIS